MIADFIVTFQNSFDWSQSTHIGFRFDALELNVCTLYLTALDIADPTAIVNEMKR